MLFIATQKFSVVQSKWLYGLKEGADWTCVEVLVLDALPLICLSISLSLSLSLSLYIYIYIYIVGRHWERDSH